MKKGGRGEGEEGERGEKEKGKEGWGKRMVIKGVGVSY